MVIFNSPLRYPGGKTVLAHFIAKVLEMNNLKNGVYIEPFAGGSGAALQLLFNGHVQRIILNDADPCIFAFWNSILSQKNTFLDRLRETRISISEWKKQRDIYNNHHRHSCIKVGFASFFLNRCNRSGILVNGGPIGGLQQAGNWKLNARFNKKELIRRIEKISFYRDKIIFYNMDAIKFLKQITKEQLISENALAYLDPPYYAKGNRLYLNYYQRKDHVKLAKFVNTQKTLKWIMSYDNVPEIHELYSNRDRRAFDLRYSAHTSKVGRELLMYSDKLMLPNSIYTSIKMPSIER